jgi:hypothetical protein
MDYSVYPGYEEFQNPTNSMNSMDGKRNMGNEEINNIISSITQDQLKPEIQLQSPQQVPNPPQQKLVTNQVSDIQKAIAQNAIDNRTINYQLNTNKINANRMEQQQQLLNEPENEKKKPQISLKLVLLGIIISLSVACALAWNEVARYYIGRSIKFYNGKPIYYVIYAIGVTVLMILSYIYSMYQ